MQRGRGGRDDFFGGFGDPFAGLPGFGGRPGSLISSFFGGRNPFDDPFFTQPFGGMMGPGPTMFGPRFGESSNAGFLEQQAPLPPNKSKGPIIEEISSDGEEEEENERDKKDNLRKHTRSSKEPFVQDPYEEVEEKKCRTVHHRNEFSVGGPVRTQAQTFSYQSSTVTYGGLNGAYYTASTTRRTGGDGFVMEESKEADTTTGKASHRVSRGIHDKGHTVIRKLNSDGRVDSLQTLHNLNEDELTGFDEAWKGKAKQHLPGWNQGQDMIDSGNTSRRRNGQQERGVRALPSAAGGQPNLTSSRGSRAQTQSRPNSFIVRID